MAFVGSIEYPWHRPDAFTEEPEKKILVKKKKKIRWHNWILANANENKNIDKFDRPYRKRNIDKCRP